MLVYITEYVRLILGTYSNAHNVLDPFFYCSIEIGLHLKVNAIL